VILLALQGAGKTTTAARLARWLKKEAQEEGAGRFDPTRLPPGCDRPVEDRRPARAGADFFSLVDGPTCSNRRPALTCEAPLLATC